MIHFCFHFGSWKIIVCKNFRGSVWQWLTLSSRWKMLQQDGLPCCLRGRFGFRVIEVRCHCCVFVVFVGDTWSTPVGGACVGVCGGGGGRCIDGAWRSVTASTAGPGGRKKAHRFWWIFRAIVLPFLMAGSRGGVWCSRHHPWRAMTVHVVLGGSRSLTGGVTGTSSDQWASAQPNRMHRIVLLDPISMGGVWCLGGPQLVSPAISSIVCAVVAMAEKQASRC